MFTSCGTLLLLPIGYTAMHYSAAWGQLTCLQLLGSKGADCFAITRHKETPKAIAQRYGHLECVQFLDNLGQSLKTS